jgi:hypothetical protein
MKTNTNQSEKKNPAKKTKRLASMIAIGSCCGFLFGHGCVTPGGLPRPPGLSMASARSVELSPLYASVVNFTQMDVAKHGEKQN